MMTVLCFARPVWPGEHRAVSGMSDAASCDADLVIDRQRRAPWRGTPQRLQAAESLLRLAGVARLVPLGHMITQLALEFNPRQALIMFKHIVRALPPQIGMSPKVPQLRAARHNGCLILPSMAASVVSDSAKPQRISLKRKVVAWRCLIWFFAEQMRTGAISGKGEAPHLPASIMRSLRPNHGPLCH
jgi:hypothetical protein